MSSFNSPFFQLRGRDEFVDPSSILAEDAFPTYDFSELFKSENIKSNKKSAKRKGDRIVIGVNGPSQIPLITINTTTTITKTRKITIYQKEKENVEEENEITTRTRFTDRRSQGAITSENNFFSGRFHQNSRPP